MMMSFRVASRPERVIRADFSSRGLHHARQCGRGAAGLVEEVRFVQDPVDRAWFGGLRCERRDPEWLGFCGRRAGSHRLTGL